MLFFVCIRPYYFISKYFFCLFKKKDDEKWKELSKSLLVVVPQLGRSFVKDVHALVQKFYSDNSHKDDTGFKNSRHQYISYALSKDSSRVFVPDEWVKEVQLKCNTSFKKSKRDLAEALTRCKENLKTFKYSDIKSLTLRVEAKFAQKCREAGAKEVKLCDIAVEFINNIGEFNLTSEFPTIPGVYFIYFIANRELYTGSQIYGSNKDPVYVGMSAKDVSSRLVVHRNKIKKAKDLEVTDFAIKVMLVDNKHYACCIEGMLIEHYKPIWNAETIGLCFGGGPKNIWHEFHVEQNPDIIKDIEEKLKITDEGQESKEDDNLIEGINSFRVSTEQGDKDKAQD